MTNKKQDAEKAEREAIGLFCQACAYMKFKSQSLQDNIRDIQNCDGLCWYSLKHEKLVDEICSLHEYRPYQDKS